MFFLFSIIANALAFLVGAGFLGNVWLIATFLLQYARSIFAESVNAPNADFSKLSDQEFAKSELNIKKSILKKLVLSAVFWGFGFLVSYLGWF